MIKFVIPCLLFYMNLIKSLSFNYHLYMYNSQTISLILTAIMNFSITFLIAYRAFPKCITANSTESIITPTLFCSSSIYSKKKKNPILIYPPGILGLALLPYKHSIAPANFSWVIIFLTLIPISLPFVQTFIFNACVTLIVFN